MICCKQRILKIARGFTKEKHVWCIRCCNEAWTSQSSVALKITNINTIVVWWRLSRNSPFGFIFDLTVSFIFFRKGYTIAIMSYSTLNYIFSINIYIMYFVTLITWFFFFLHKRGMFWFAHTCTIIIYF